jgi:CheY-like chemotaxis protein
MTTEGQGSKTILVVEDDTATRDALAMILSAQGFTVVGAANGQEALSVLRGESQPDLILLDLMMPIMDGWQFRREQARDPGLFAIPVVVLSADGNVQQKAASLRAADYLQKPVDVDSLLEVIQRQL